jgi:NTE family protein
MLGALNQSIAIMGQKLGQAELARADIVIRPKVLDIGAADFSQRANAIVEGEKAALAVMPQLRERVAKLQAERTKATQLAQQKAAEAQHLNCLEQRSQMQKLAGMAGRTTPAPAPEPQTPACATAGRTPRRGHTTPGVSC